MNAQELLDEIFRTKNVFDEKGNKYKLDSNMDKDDVRPWNWYKEF